MQDEETPGATVRGASLHGGFCPAYKFTLDKYFSDSGKEWILTGVEHAAKQPLVLSPNTQAFEYSNGFACIASSTPYRPPRVTPPPRVKGLQSAMVVGPAGEEIYTDQYSRVKVQFHWDREGKNDEKSSCWIRVAG